MSTSDDYVTNCPHCSSPIGRRDRVELRGHLEVYRCPSCGNEVTLTASYSDDLPRQASLRTVKIRLDRSSVAADTIRAIRTISPEFQEMSLSELKKNMSALDEITIYDLTDDAAEELADRASKVGLDVEIQ